jgi:hypothetical protein
MNSKTVHDIYLEARAMQREGMSARKIAIRMGTLGAENGLAPIRTIGVGDQIDQHFERTGETIWSDGYDWHYSRAALKATEVPRLPPQPTVCRQLSGMSECPAR